MGKISISLEEIKAFDRLHRINLINSVSGYKPANLIATCNEEGKQNLAIFSSIVHIGSSPPLLAMVTRPTTVPRHTLDNIYKTGSYTINHVNDEIIEAAHHTSAKYPKDVSEFKMTQLTPVFKDGFHAPFVKESRLQIAMKYIESKNLEINGTVFVIGEIQKIFLDKEAYLEDGSIDLNLLNTSAISGLDTYHTVKQIAKYPYARPKK